MLRSWPVLGLSDGLQTPLNRIKELSPANGGTRLPRTNERSVNALNPSSDPLRTPLDLDKPVQNATEDAVDTVYRDALEAFRSPWLHNILKTKHQPVVSAIAAPAFRLPLDGLLPAEIVARVDASPPQDSHAIVHAGPTPSSVKNIPPTTIQFAPQLPN